RSRKNLLGDRPEGLSAASRLRVDGGSEHPTQYARDVRVDESGAPLVGERRHGPRRIRADSGKLLELRGMVGQRSFGRAPGIRHRSGESMKISGASVITE